MELKPSDNSNNPYLALGALIAAGLDGVARKLDPGEAVICDPGTMSESERAARNIRRLPMSLGEALDTLERDSLLMEALGDLLGRAFLTVKRSENETFGNEDEAFELAQHFYKY